MPEIKPDIESFAKIKVVGVGGSGCSILNRMLEKGVKGVEFIAVNTDVQALHISRAPIKIQIGKAITRGLGAGMNPELGRKAAEENENEIQESLRGADMVFVTCGLGGGTGTGAAPIIADIARNLGALTIAVVTKPFSFEGAQRRQIADKGFAELASKVDSIITIPNDRLLQTIDKRTSLLEAFIIADEVLHHGVRGISELITVPGLINVDFADVKAIMENTGSSLMGIGIGKGENRAIQAAKDAIESPLLDLSIDGAKGILFTIAGPSEMSMYEVNEAARVITESADPNAKIIFGAIIDDTLSDQIKITVIATDFSKEDDAGNYSRLHSAEYAPTSFVRTVEESLEKRRTDLKKLQRKPADERKKDFGIETQHLNISRKEETQTTQDGSEDIEIPAFIRRKMQS